MNGCEPTTRHGKELGISKILPLASSLEKLRTFMKHRTYKWQAMLNLRTGNKDRRMVA